MRKSKTWILQTMAVAVALFFVTSCTGDEEVVIPLDVTTQAISDITHNSAVSGGIVINNGGDATTARGVCWSTNQNPTIDDTKTTESTDVFVSEITGLAANTTYFVRSYATNANGTYYGNEQTFKTAVILPDVTTESVSGISYTFAVGGGTVSSNSGETIIARGLCWSKSQSPTIADSKTEENTDTFTSDLTGLEANTTYYVRTYATNSIDTYYGNEQTFKTSSLDDTTWDFLLIHSSTISWHADVIFYADGTTKYDEPDAPGEYTTYGTWSLTDGELYYDMDSSDPANTAYIFSGTFTEDVMSGTYSFGAETKTWTAMEKN